MLENLQALCYMCNAKKQNKDDDTDFRGWEKDVYDARDKDCVFCNLRKEARIEIKNSFAVAFEDNKYPVTEGRSHACQPSAAYAIIFLTLELLNRRPLLFPVRASKGEEIMHTDSRQ